MLTNKSDNTITACVAIFNEEALIERCLLSIKDLADEIIVIHDGECTDNSLNIARKYTDKIFIREHMGFIESHLVFAYNQAKCDWVLRIDADEYLDTKSHQIISELVENTEYDGYSFLWELWDGSKVVNLNGLYKSCLFKKNHYSFCDIPGNIGKVDGRMKNIDIILHHRPVSSNISWQTSLNKTRKWAPIQAKYFFPELVEYKCFRCNIDDWIRHSHYVRKTITWHIIKEPIKTFIGQLKSGKWRSLYGWQFVLQHVYYYFILYTETSRLKKNLKNNKF